MLEFLSNIHTDLGILNSGISFLRTESDPDERPLVDDPFRAAVRDRIITSSLESLSSGIKNALEILLDEYRVGTP